MALLVAVAMTARLAMLHLSTIKEEMTWGYLNSAYALAAGLGFQRTAGAYGVEGLSEHAAELAARRETLSPANRPDVALENLRPIHHRLPGYAAYLTTVYRALGEPLERNAGIVQAVVTALYPLLIFLIGARLLQTRRYAWIAAWIAALYPPLLHVSSQLLPVGFVVGFVLLATYFGLRGVQEERYGLILLAGLALGIGCYFKSNILYLWVFFGIAFAFAQREWKRPVVGLLLLGLVTHLTVLPWALRNYDLTGELHWGSTMTGNTVWKSVGEQPNRWGVVSLDSYAHELAKANGFEDEMTPAADKWFRSLFVGYVIEDPWFFVETTLKSLPRTLAPPFSPGFANPNRDRGIISHFMNEEGKSLFAVLRSETGYVLGAYWERILVSLVGLSAVLGLLGVFAFDKDRRAAVVWLSIVPTYLISVHTPLNAASRYLSAMIPFQILAIALVAEWLASRAHNVHGGRRKGGGLTPAPSARARAGA